MTGYIDTSVLVAALTGETRATDMQLWLAGQPRLFTSWWLPAEFASALSRKVREGILGDSDAASLRRVLRDVLSSSFTVLPVTSREFVTAEGYVAVARAGLRASDALHLATAATHDLHVVTLDKRMASGGAAVGVATLLL